MHSTNVLLSPRDDTNTGFFPETWTPKFVGIKHYRGSFLEGQLSVHKATGARGAFRHTGSQAHTMTDVVHSVDIRRSEKYQEQHLRQRRERKVSRFILIIIPPTGKLALFILSSQGVPGALAVTGKHPRGREVSTFQQLAPLGAGGRPSG